MVDLIKPSDLAAAATVFPDDAMVVDAGGVVRRATPLQVVDAGAPAASEAVAIAGVNNTLRMTPLRTKQVLDNVTAPSVLRAAAWAESPTPPDPTNLDSKSSKSWAEDAEAAAERAALFGVRQVASAEEFFALPVLIPGFRYSSQDGMAWDVLLSGIGDFVQAGRQISVVGREVDVMAFGVSSVGFTVACQRAVDKLKKFTSDTSFHPSGIGGVIIIPAGRYSPSGTVFVDGGGIFIKMDEMATAFDIPPTFSGSEVFLFCSNRSAGMSPVPSPASIQPLLAVGCSGGVVNGNNTGVGLVRFVRCRDQIEQSSGRQYYSNAPIVVMDTCEGWLIDKNFWMPWVTNPTADGIQLWGAQEGTIGSQNKFFGWDSDNVNKTTGYAIRATLCEELRIQSFDCAFLGGGGLYQDRCNYVQVDKFQCESSTRAILVTSNAASPSAIDNLYCVYQGLILDSAPVEIDYSTGAIVQDFGSSSTVTFGPNTDRCTGQVSGGRGAIYTDNGTNNLITADLFGRMTTRKGFRVEESGGRFEGVGNVVFASVSGNTIQSALILQPTTAAFTKPLQVNHIWDQSETGNGFRMGPYRLWVDSTGRLRIKSGAPTSDTDGTVVGTQT